MAATRQRKRRHELEPEEDQQRPVRYGFGATRIVRIKPTMYAVCAVCGWSHSTISLNDNAYHEACLDALVREWHAPPENLEREGRA